MTVYSIKDLEHLSGIKAHTIRIWEKRYALLDPNRTDTNIRSYSDNDVRRILNVAMLVKNGYKISSVATFDEQKLQDEVIRINRNANDPDKDIDQLLFHTVNLDTFGFEAMVDKIIGEFGFSKTIQQVIFPFFERIGILWQAGSIFTAHEHFVSNLIRNRLIGETAKLVNKEASKSALFFLRENEWHELGLLYFNFLAAQAGFRCVYLGQSLPFEDLANLLTANKYDFVCTSFVHAIEKPELELYLANLSLVFNQDKILIAGRQIAIHKPKLPSNVLVVKNSNDFIKRISG
ncbi:transcriptional regulator, MerR family [Aquipluma nitroreducens]|uniref:Transcriptional regulator, MerR family n=1 Tax=Aquipluma nitroreducens TaxID=2010828 RepID=A0A5K7S533_9BACT|nr:MerR family transcriptional regulator [Aquipluma nitroreducens]BBE16671.1 transcriptional regulator, MerR family [Aquipluma nitroreducens]